VDAKLMEKFSSETDHTGRFIVYSFRTGKKYFVEPIGNPHTNWGSIDPATNTLVNKKGAGKYRGSIDAKDSLITEENGFENIDVLPPGYSPFAEIEHRDSQYPDKEQ
jgi:hypothetical protein